MMNFTQSKLTKIFFLCLLFVVGQCKIIVAMEKAGEGTLCMVCSNPLLRETTEVLAVVSGCNHPFHTACIEHKQECPLCKRSIIFSSEVMLKRISSEIIKNLLHEFTEVHDVAGFTEKDLLTLRKYFDTDQLKSERFEKYQVAAAWGEAKAQNNLGSCYVHGEGVEQDLVQAVAWYRKAVDQGEARAQFNLGVCYANGKGVERDLVQAVGLYRAAADHGDAKAQFNLGACYKKGKGVQRDLVQAVGLYRAAADQGYAGAQFNLGFCYEKGEGVEQDLAKAVAWYRRAADQGEAVAQSNLGVCYKEGKGVEKDSVQAAEWFRKAAEQGCVAAQFNLGLCYANGKGVEKDLAQAAKWFRKTDYPGSVTPGLINNVVIDGEELEFESLRDSIRTVTRCIDSKILERGTCEVLDFGSTMNNYITDNILQELVKMCKFLTDLKILNFANNRIGDAGLLHLWPLLGHERLKYIVLDRNYISVNGIEKLLGILGTSPLYRDTKGNLEREEKENAVRVESREALQLAHKIVWISKGHIDGAEGIKAISRETAKAHRTFYASDYAIQVGCRI